MNPISDPLPVADAAPDPQAPAGAAPVADTDAFAAMLAAAASLGPPPTPGQAEAARTAAAGGTKAGSDSPGPIDTTDVKATATASPAPGSSDTTGVKGGGPTLTSNLPESKDASGVNGAAPTDGSGGSSPNDATAVTGTLPAGSQATQAAYTPASGSLGEDGLPTGDLPGDSPPEAPAAAPSGAPAAAASTDTEALPRWATRLPKDPDVPPPIVPGAAPTVSQRRPDPEVLAGPARSPAVDADGGEIPVDAGAPPAPVPASAPPAAPAGKGGGDIPISFSTAADPQKATGAHADATAGQPVGHATETPPAGGDESQHPAGAKRDGTPGQADEQAPGPARGSEPASTPAATGVENGATRDALPAEREQPLVRPVTARLHELVEKAQATIRVAIRDGHTDARITLRPPELGEVKITLRYEGGGVSALLTADSGKAVEVLAQASADLRRSLEQQGLSVHGLDVRLAGDDARQGGAAWRDPSPFAPARLGRYREDDDHDQQPEGTEPATRVTEAGRIDVLA